MTANKERGEVSLELEPGFEYVLRPTFEARAEFEDKTGLSLIQLANAAGDGSMTVRQAAAIVTACVKARAKTATDADEPHIKAASRVSEARIGELIYEMEGGLMVALLRLYQMLAWAASGQYTAQGMPKPGKPEAA